MSGVTKSFFAHLGRNLLLDVQEYRCGSCGGQLEKGIRSTEPRGMSLEHVWPKRMGFGLQGNAVFTHRECNDEKADRSPNGCELIFLQAVNRKLGLPEEDTKYFDTPWLTERQW